MLYRRVDIEDAVSAVSLDSEGASDRIRPVHFLRLDPFTSGNLDLLGRDAPAAVRGVFPEYAELYAARGWRRIPSLDRIYINARVATSPARNPRYNFRRVLDCLALDQEFRSALALEVGSKGYHERTSQRARILF